MDIRRRGNKPGAAHASMPAKATFDVRKPQPRPPQKSPLGPMPQIPEPTPEAIPEPPTVVEESQVIPPVLETTVKEDPDVIDDAVEEPTPAPQTKEKSAPNTATKTVEIKISLPAMPSLKPITEHQAYIAAKVQAAKLPRKKLTLGSIIIAVALLITGSSLSPDHDAKVAADKKGTQYDLTRGIPEYPTVLPDSKTIQDLGGWTLVSPPDRDPAFAYIDKIGNMQINVSQQPLPESLKPDTAEKIERLAKDYGASEKITVDDTTVHIGSSEKGPQSIIFTKSGLLILIKSSVRIDSNEWAKYVNSLQ